MVSKLRLKRLTDSTIGNRESDILEGLYHLVAPEPLQVTAILRGARILRLGFSEFFKIGTLLQQIIDGVDLLLAHSLLLVSSILGEQLENVLGMYIFAIAHIIYSHHVDAELSGKRLGHGANGSAVDHVLDFIGEHARTDEAKVTLVARHIRISRETACQFGPGFTIHNTRADAVHQIQRTLRLLLVIAQRQHEVVEIEFLLTALISLIDKLPAIGRVFGQVRRGQVVLVALKFLSEEFGGVDSSSLGICHLEFVEHKAVNILLESLFLNLLLFVLVVEVLKL